MLAARLHAPPSYGEWRRALSLGLALLGGALVGSALVYAVAFNWAAMPREVRLALPIVSVCCLSLAGLRLGMERLGGVVLLSLAAVLVGTEFLVYGQTYQTGADAWQLFAVWALCIAPWVALARFAPLALVWILLVNVAFGTFWDVWDVSDFFDPRTRGIVGAALVTTLNGALLFAWERWGEQTLRASDGRWGPRVLGVLAVAPATFAMWWALIETGEGHESGTSVLIAAPTLAILLFAMYTAYRRRRRDLFQLTLFALSVASCIGVGVARGLSRLGHFSPFTVLLMGVVVLLLVVATAGWLRAVHREGEAG